MNYLTINIFRIFRNFKKNKDFAHFKKEKGSAWKKRVSGCNPKKGTKENKVEDVHINIGLIQWDEKDKQLKVRRGKRVLCKVCMSDCFIYPH